MLYGLKRFPLVLSLGSCLFLLACCGHDDRTQNQIRPAQQAQSNT